MKKLQIHCFEIVNLCDVMPIEIAILAKQVPDPDIPTSRIKVNEIGTDLEIPEDVSPIVNGFDLNATEAALKLRDDGLDVNITVIMVGNDFVNDVVKKPISMGADNLVLVEDENLTSLSPRVTVNVLCKILTKTGPFDLILAGRQASDFDNAHVPIGVAETMGIPVITYARKIEIVKEQLKIERVTLSGYQIIESPMPVVVTVSNEVGEPRYPNLRGIMAATKKNPELFSLNDLNFQDSLAEGICLKRMFVRENDNETEIIKGSDDADAGRKLAIRLKEEGLL